MSVASFVSLFQIDALTQKKRADDILANLTQTLPVMAQVEVTVFAMVAVTGRIHPNEWTRGSPKRSAVMPMQQIFLHSRSEKTRSPQRIKKTTRQHSARWPEGHYEARRRWIDHSVGRWRREMLRLGQGWRYALSRVYYRLSTPCVTAYKPALIHKIPKHYRWEEEISSLDSTYPALTNFDKQCWFGCSDRQSFCVVMARSGPCSKNEPCSLTHTPVSKYFKHNNNNLLIHIKHYVFISSNNDIR